MTRDSAGVAIVINSPSSKAASPLLLARMPTVQIGNDDAPAYQFNGIVAATRLADGRYAVADNGSAQIRIYTPQGRIERTLGGRGAGPGEFGVLRTMWVHGRDSIRAWDGRITEFALDSGAARTRRLRKADGSDWNAAGAVRGMLADGSFFAYDVRSAAVPSTEIATRDTVVVWHVGPRGSRGTRTGAFLWREIRRSTSSFTMTVPGSREGSRAVIIRGQPFALNTQLAATRNALISTNAFGAFEWQARSPSGALRRIVRVDRPRIELSAELVRRQQEREHVPSSNFALASPPLATDLPRSAYPRQIPAYDALRVDRAQRVWVRWMAADATAPERWDVFSDDGQLLDTVEMPSRFAFFDADVTGVVGVWRDEDDIEFVRAYRFVRVKN